MFRQHAEKSMNSQENNINYKQVMSYIDGFLFSKAMFVACEFGLFDLLEEENVPLSASDISQKLKSSLRGTQILLNTCQSMRLLSADKHCGKVHYQMTEMARTYLRKNSNDSLVPWIKFFSQTLYPSSQYFAQAVREGKQQVGKVFGDANMEYFDAMYSCRDQLIQYLGFLTSAWNICGGDIITAFDLSSFKNVCDLGGNSGSLARIFISTYPDSRVTVFDLPKMIQTAKQHNMQSDDPRISFQEGDLLKDPVPSADLYIIARVIHVFSEEKCIELLRKIYAACNPGGAILLIETFLKDHNDEMITANAHDCAMLLFTEGKEYTATEMSLILKESGFQDVEFKSTGMTYDPMIGRKVLKSF